MTFRPKLKLRIRTLLGLVAAFALLLAVWAAYFDPVRSWQNAIHDDNNGLRRWEAITRAQGGRAAGIDSSTAIGSIADALSDPSVRVRQTAALSLPRFGPDSRRAITALVMALGDPDFLVRAYSADALGKAPINPTDPDRAKVISALNVALKDRNENVRLSAALALARQGEGTAALPTLIGALGPRNAMTRLRVIWGLKFISRTEARTAIPALMRLVADSAGSEVDIPLKLGRVYAAELLFHLGDEEPSLLILDDAANSSDVIVCDEARLIRKRLSPTTTLATPAQEPRR